MKAPATFEPELLRSQFPLIRDTDCVYLDNAATTQKPLAVLDAVNNYYRHANANVHRAAHQLSERATEQFESARRRVAAFLNAPSEREVIWTRGTTEAINLVAGSYTTLLGPGDEILVSTLEHHSNIVPWQQLAQRSGATLRPIPIDTRGDLDLDAYRNLLGPNTRIVALTQLSNALGTVTPLQTCIEQAHRVGAVVLVDGAQGVAHLPIDVRQLDCDFYAFSGHKVYAPTGIGVLWGKEHLLEQLPPWQYGGEMIEHVSFAGTRFNRLPFKFEAGTPNIAGALGLAAALEFVDSLDRPAVRAHEQRLLQSAIDAIGAIPGIRVVGSPKQRAAVLPFNLDGHHSYDLATLLNQQRIAIRTGHLCTMPLMEALGQPSGVARASFALYNTESEVERLAAALRHLLVQPSAINSAATEATTIAEQLARCRSWQERYRHIMKLGQQHPGMAGAEKTETNRLHGCTSQVWLNHRVESGRFYFELDSDAKVIRGLGAVLLEAVNGLTLEELNASDLEHYLSQLGLAQHLSPSRTNGVKAIIQAIQAIAACPKTD